MPIFEDNQPYYPTPQKHLLAALVPVAMVLAYKGVEAVTARPELRFRVLCAVAFFAALAVFLKLLFTRSRLTITVNEQNLEIEDVPFPWSKITERIPKKNITSAVEVDVATIKDLASLMKNRRQVYSVKKFGLRQMLKKEPAVHLTLADGRSFYIVPQNPSALINALSRT